MKAKKEEQQATMSQEEAFRGRTHHYLMCFIDSCPLKDRCLHWLVGQYGDPQPWALMSMNPRNPKVGGEKCEKFRPNERTVMKKGMTHFYVDMPARVEKAIRQALIMQFGRTQYFEMRNGKRLITPSDQELIADICHDYGWNGPFVYDGEEEDWLW
jgi:hypothetical protein